MKKQLTFIIARCGFAFIIALVISCKTTDRGPGIIHVDEKPPDGTFQLTQTKIDVPCVDFEHAIVRDELGYPRVDFRRFDRENPGRVIKTLDAIVLENKYIRLTLLPDKGKPYSFVYKVTGHEELFIPTVAQVFGSPNRLGWWYGLGGVEYTMPDEEHGDTWAADWEWKIVEDSPGRKTIRMKVRELRHGLIEIIDVSIVPDKAHYEAAVRIENPTDKPIDFQHWINPMWAPGGRGEITIHTEFIMPTRNCYVTERPFNEWMLAYDPEGSRIQPYGDSPLRFLPGWKNIGDLLAWKLEHGFYSAFSHDEDEGIVRVFPKEKNPGCNIWAWGIDPKPETRKHFSGSETCRGYVEMWGGITRGFDEYHRLNPGETISWVEWMFPYHQTDGLHFANQDFAVTFTRFPTGEYVVKLCPSGDLRNVQCRVISTKTRESLLHVFFDSFYPKKKIPKFSFVSIEEAPELIIVRNGMEVVRMTAGKPPKFPEATPNGNRL